MRTSASWLLAIAFLPALSAQTAPGLVAFTRNSFPAVIKVNTTTCQLIRCVPVFPSALGLPAWSGGTAYDPTAGGTWITNGTKLGLVTESSCSVLCQNMNVPGISTAAVATGLAYNEITKTLFVSDDQNLIHTVAVAGCTLTVTTSCQTWPVSANNPTIGGLATDDIQGLIFYTGSMWSATGPANNTLFIAKQSTPCQTICKIPVPNCTTLPNPLGPITGLAHDCCKKVLWATDGYSIVGFSYNLTACTAQVISCCTPVNPNGQIMGLDTLPSLPQSKDQSTTGASCIAPPCPACSLMVQVMNGSPTIGNPAFSLELQNAPAGVNGVFVLNAGPCGAGVPFGCGQIFVPLLGWIALGPLPTGGTVGCTGGSTLTFSLAPNPAFCGIVLSSQFAVICTTPTTFGTGLSNCLSFSISGT